MLYQFSGSLLNVNVDFINMLFSVVILMANRGNNITKQCNILVYMFDLP